MNEKLVNEAVAGSKEAFVSLYGEYKDRLYRYALYRLGDPTDAEDAVSECVLAAWKNIHSLRSSKAFGSWIFSILAKCCAGQIKQTIASRENLGRIYKDGPGGYGEVAGMQSCSSAAIEVSEALGQLSEEEREIVLLSVIGGFSSKEISAMTGLTSGSVRSKLSRSLAKMREYLS